MIDNCINSIETGCTRRRNLYGKYVQETYSYIDREGNHASIRLRGRNKEETDEKFQRHVMSEVRKKDVPTVRQFVDAVYRPSFMTGLAATTLANYEQYLRKNILPYMGDMPMDAVNVATLQQFYARTRHEGVMKHQKTLEMINSEYLFGSNAAPKNAKNPGVSTLFEVCLNNFVVLHDLFL